LCECQLLSFTQSNLIHISIKEYSWGRGEGEGSVAEKGGGQTEKIRLNIVFLLDF